MPGLFLAAPYQPPAVHAAPAWSGLSSMVWTGWDGSQWDLMDTNGGVLLIGGVRGLNMPTVTRYTSASPAVAGSRWRGSLVGEREVFWPLFVFNDGGSQEWLDYDDAFWRTLDPNQTGTWSVTRPNGQTRTLKLRFVDDGGQTFDIDPSKVGWATYGVTLIAEQPYWLGDPVTQTWQQGDPTSFFGPTGFGPPFTVTSGSMISNATMSNPGDVDAYPLWVLTGPITTASVGVGANVTQYQASIAAGRAVVIDSAPDQQRVLEIPAPPTDLATNSPEWFDWVANAMATGTDRVLNLGKVAFNAPIPPGKSVKLSLSMVGAGTVTAAIRPPYYRAI